jgi:hypothetical protein
MMLYRGPLCCHFQLSHRRIQWVMGRFPPLIKRSEREAAHSLPLVPKLSLRGGIPPFPIHLHGTGTSLLSYTRTRADGSLKPLCKAYLRQAHEVDWICSSFQGTLGKITAQLRTDYNDADEACSVCFTHTLSQPETSQ